MTRREQERLGAEQWPACWRGNRDSSTVVGHVMLVLGIGRPHQADFHEVEGHASHHGRDLMFQGPELQTGAIVLFPREGKTSCL